MKKNTWSNIIQFLITVLTAVATAIFKVPKIQLLENQYITEMLNKINR